MPRHSWRDERCPGHHRGGWDSVRKRAANKSASACLAPASAKERVPVLAPEGDLVLLGAAGFSDAEFFHAAFTFKGRVQGPTATRSGGLQSSLDSVGKSRNVVRASEFARPAVWTKLIAFKKLSADRIEPAPPAVTRVYIGLWGPESTGC
jgi:hypothetical protein